MGLPLRGLLYIANCLKIRKEEMPAKLNNVCIISDMASCFTAGRIKRQTIHYNLFQKLMFRLTSGIFFFHLSDINALLILGKQFLKRNKAVN
mgnify:CR=1 FL=1